MKKPPKTGSSSENDAALWKKLAKTVKPYLGKTTGSQNSPKKPAAAAAPKEKPAPLPEPASKPHRPLSQPVPKPLALGTAGFDRATATKLKKGKMPLEARLDLHGMNQSVAKAVLHRFISMALKNEKRTVLIITGKGRLSEQGGVLRRMLPLWLEEPSLAKHIIALTPAAPKDGGTGAFYLRLRQKKEKKKERPL